ncbi:MAG TPA: hypothetical protein VEC16_00390 [Alphaproteobacteria bacterium]|nr:hypothetical protein [Alphaproteobacteria bacterium]
MNDIYKPAQFDAQEERLLLSLDSLIRPEPKNFQGKYITQEIIPAFGGYKLVVKNTKVPKRLRIEIPIVPIDNTNFSGFKNLLMNGKNGHVEYENGANYEPIISSNFDMPVVPSEDGEYKCFKIN